MGAVSAPLLNTVFYMGLMVLLFYNCEYVQSRVAELGVVNPIMFVLAVVGVQGLVEVLVCGTVGCVVSKAIDTAFGKRAAPQTAE